MPRRRSRFPRGGMRRRMAGGGPAFLILLVTVWCGASASSTVADEVIGAKNSKVYHTHPEACSAARRISPENRIRFASAEEAEKAGRRLCKICAGIDRRRSQGEGKRQEDASRGRKEETGPQREDGRPGGKARIGVPLSSEAVATLPEFARVAKVLPGGTIELDIGEKARLLGVACPQEGQPCAEDAVRFIDEQTRGRRVRLACDASPGLVGHRDSLGRLLVYLTPEPGGRDLGGELTFQGYAWLDREARFDRRAEYTRRQEEAWRANRGIWKPLEGGAGEEKVVIGRHAHHYHDPGCPHVAHLTGAMTITVNEARARRLPPCPYYHIADKVKDKDQIKRKIKDRGKENKEPQ